MVALSMKQVMGGSYERIKELYQIFNGQWIELDGVRYNLPRVTK